MGVCVSRRRPSSASPNLQPPGQSATFGLESKSSSEIGRAAPHRGDSGGPAPLHVHTVPVGSDQQQSSPTNAVIGKERRPNGGEDFERTTSGPQLVKRSQKKKRKLEPGPQSEQIKMEDRMVVIDRRPGTVGGRDRMKCEQPIMKVLLMSENEKPDDLTKNIKEACRACGYLFEKMHSRKDVKVVFQQVSDRLSKELEVVRQSRLRHRLEDMGRRGPTSSQVPPLPEVEEEGETSASDKSTQGSADPQVDRGVFHNGVSPPDLLLIDCRSSQSTCSASACEFIRELLELGQCAEACVFAVITGKISSSQFEAVHRGYLRGGFHEIISYDRHLNWKTCLLKFDHGLCRLQFTLEETRAAWMLLDCSPVSYEITSSNVRFQYVNEAFENMTGYRAERVLGHTPKQILKSSMNMDVPWYGHYFGRRQSGYHYPQSVQIMPCPSIYGPPHHVTIKQDLSKHIVTNLCLKQLCVVGRRTLALLDGTDVTQGRKLSLPDSVSSLTAHKLAGSNGRRHSTGDSTIYFRQPNIEGQDSLLQSTQLGDGSPLVNGVPCQTCGSSCPCIHHTQSSPPLSRHQQSSSVSTQCSLQADHMYQRMTEMVNQLEVREVLQRAMMILENDSEKLDETIYHNYMAQVQQYMNDLRSDTDTTALYNIIVSKKELSPIRKEKSFVTGLMNLRAHRGSISNSATSSQKSVEDDDRDHVQCLRTRLTAYYRSQPVILDTMKTYQSWSDFDIFTLEHHTNHKPLYALGMKIFDEHDACALLKVNWSVIEKWLMLIESYYHNGINSYHNSTHAADVLQAAACFLRHAKLKFLDPLEKVATLLAAVIHDLDHPGLTGPYLSKVSHPLAEMYNDRSVLENHHLRVAFSLTRQHPEANIFQNLEKDDFKNMKATMVELVLATDITQHRTIMKEFSGQLEALETFPPARASLLAMLKVLLKVADVSNPGRPLDLCVIWAERIAQEYVHQSDLEKAKDLPLTFAMFSRSSYDLPSSQLSFYDFLVKPMFEAFHSYMKIDDLRSHTETNYAHWERQKELGGCYQPVTMRTTDRGSTASLDDTIRLSTDYASLRPTLEQSQLLLPVISISSSTPENLRENPLSETKNPEE